MRFDIVRESPATERPPFRTAAVIGKFDLQSDHITERFTGDILMPDDWQIGLIVGHSGTGKSTIARELFTDSYFVAHTYTPRPVIEDMPDAPVDDITGMFNSVGFSSPPSWLKPYAVLSNGERMRVDLARALLMPAPLVVFDEFTSVVDRNVAQIGSYAVQKAIRRTAKKFIAVTCHEDVSAWLQPDWIFDTTLMRMRDEIKKNGQTSLSMSDSVTGQYGQSFGSIII